MSGVLTAPASASAASATIYACVKRTSGATRIVGARAKCRRGEQKLSWSTAGTAGKDGAPGLAGVPGAEGKAGANGAAVVFDGGSFPAQTLTKEAATIVVTKVVPPGSYAVFARTVFISEDPAAAFAEAFCELAGVPGTAGAGEPSVIDLTTWAGPLGEKGKGEFVAQGSVSLQGVYTSAVTSADAVGVTRIG